MNAAELQTNKELTKWFIGFDPTTLVLTPNRKVDDGAGGRRLVAQPARAPQVFRLIPQSDRVPEVQTSDGRFARPEYVLMGEASAAMAPGDTFSWGGRSWEVAQVHEKPIYESKGDVIRVV